MPINVKDAAGATVPLETPNANGRAAASGSRPVALATEDKAALDAIAAKIIAAPATEAKQDTVIGKLGTLGQKVSSGSAPVVLASDQSAISTQRAQGAVTQTKITLVAATAQTALAANANAKGVTILNYTASPLYLTSGGLTVTPASGAPSDYVPAAAAGVPGAWFADYLPIDGLRVVSAAAGDLTVVSW